jgi:hypothetical protein
MANLQNQYYTGIACSAVLLQIFAVLIRFDMPDYQKSQVGILSNLVVTFSWVDFIGDVSWAHQRLHAYERGDEEDGVVYGVLSIIILFVSVFITAIRISLALKRGMIREGYLNSNAFITVFIISWTDPDAVILFPWSEEAFSGLPNSPFPNRTFLRVTMYKLFEDVPQFFIQAYYLIFVDFDVFTAANLALTVIFILYMVIGKLFLILLSEESVGMKENEDAQIQQETGKLEENKGAELVALRLKKSVEERAAQRAAMRAAESAAEIDFLREENRKLKAKVHRNDEGRLASPRGPKTVMAVSGANSLMADENFVAVQYELIKQVIDIACVTERRARFALETAEPPWDLAAAVTMVTSKEYNRAAPLPTLSPAQPLAGHVFDSQVPRSRGSEAVASQVPEIPEVGMEVSL